ncbi:hypothetical protein BCV72DRAFT_265936 [Rhizopus microsporus var. microsporus]|uniref:Endoplasmic reticulum protein n=2 Tax=Rhizopus microsporus TaxID=58291 RepID=A0A2G4SUA9_RHIZD|nr:uncharacterized protein RHIMIDRAFT_313785 [Rhizopus microsporus ATCC 52813]ORE01246.1 hypothetical protein BCV72DRAFT_265936 [Rhizopus microsporus var. microsporus]PHZ12368.1 hypothetical protein RHIMIDRAFT_313785 [Rhizopus microsporus ATCC 52813]
MTLSTEQFKTLHFAWFVGHGLIFLSCLISILLYPFSIFYRFAYISVISTYSIVLYNSYKPLQQGLPIKRMLLDENTQYFIISVYFLFTKKRLATLLPFIVYSSFHILEYAETELIPTLFPDQTQLQTRIKEFRTKYYEQAMDLTSRYEVCGIMGLLLLGFFVLRTSLTCLLLYAHFLRMRYFMSTYTRNYIDGIFGHIDRLLTTHPKVPPTVVKTYAKVKEAWMSDPIEKKKL